MRRFRRAIIGILAVLGVVALAACSGGGAGGASGGGQVIQLTVGTTNSSSSFYAYWASVAQAVNAELQGDIQLNIVESGSTVDNLNRMKDGEFDFGNSALATVYQAYKGDGDWEAMPELRWFWSFAHMPYLVVVREDSGITNIEQLDGKTFSGGDIGSGSFVGVQNAFHALGIEPNWLKGSFADGATAIKDRQAVGMSKLTPGVRAQEAMYMDIMTSTDVRFVGLTPEQEAKVKEAWPIYTWFTIPAGVYPGQDYDVRTWGDLAGGTVSSKLPQDVGYRIVKAVVATKGKQVEAFPAAEAVDFIEDTVLKGPIIPLHAGTVQFLKEQGVDVPAELIPPEYQE